MNSILTKAKVILNPKIIRPPSNN